VTSTVEVYHRFLTREAAIAHLEQVRWADAPQCPYCSWTWLSHNRDASRGTTAERWKCQKCLRSFSVTVGTIFHNSHIDLQRWFLLISLMLNAKNGLSAAQAARDLKMRRPTVWSMMNRVRAALKNEDKLLAGIIETLM
jgi:transposase-like protein